MMHRQILLHLNMVPMTLCVPDTGVLMMLHQVRVWVLMMYLMGILKMLQRSP